MGVLRYKIIRGTMKIVFYFMVVIFCLWIIFPFYWLLVNSVTPMQDLMRWPPSLIPSRVTLDNFAQLFAQTKAARQLLNTSIVASGSTLLTLLLATLGGYSISRFHYKGRDTIARFALFTYMFPRVMLVIPFFVLATRFGIVDSYIGLILAHTALNIPFTLWLMRAFFLGIPIDLEESATVDGASRFQAFYKVALPVAVPGVISVGFIAFSWSWNELLFAIVLTSTDAVRTMPVGLAVFALQYGWIVHLLLAGSVVFLIPPLLIFIASQRYVVKGLAAGALKE